MMRLPSAMGWLLGAALAAPIQAADKPPVDAGLLEFLGSIDRGGAGWSEYLESTDVHKVAPPAKAPGARKPIKPPPPPNGEKT